ncbi:LIC_10463 family lipoprotein [Leptospira alstonii]|uniref:Lipoprotein n=2 Tax=Leptospira alstonii TaxID=28452 RepID=M6CWB9_9LEPT|nr:hypothetical protein [Leptospira alstonii]EMJ93228.1 hypothetical protein LEP1GSC194_1817 [Leptospira alstonii serovar Sichuan str. 79601]EQA78372.1 hypothetical protein LEP1GSC193_4163 [Leptospira alstonii serovar Pingchang str. 80-412]
MKFDPIRFFESKRSARFFVPRAELGIRAVGIVLWIFCGVLAGCKEEEQEKLSFIRNDRNGMIRLQSVKHGQLNGGLKEYSFILKQAENVQGVFQIDSVGSNVRIRLTKKNFRIRSTTDCIPSVSENLRSCRLEIPSLEKGKYILSVFEEGPTSWGSDFNLFSGIYGKGYADFEL